jgi:hypothetical protein
LLAVVARTCNLLIIRLTQEDLRSKLDWDVIVRPCFEKPKQTTPPKSWYFKYGFLSVSVEIDSEFLQIPKSEDAQIPYKAM